MSALRCSPPYEAISSSSIRKRVNERQLEGAGRRKFMMEVASWMSTRRLRISSAGKDIGGTEEERKVVSVVPTYSWILRS